ncbi:MAG: FkbM family methyltransferase [Betaproteobacteria bacterium]|nr:FkbM family methyltransferase [Betaproteobacteria bacterium]
MHAIIKSLIPGDMIFDIGANVGDKAARFADQGMRIICIEPQIEIARILRSRFESNENIVVRQVGVGEKRGRLEMRVSSTNPVLSTFADHWGSGRFSGHRWDCKRLGNTP